MKNRERALHPTLRQFPGIASMSDEAAGIHVAEAVKERPIRGKFAAETSMRRLVYVSRLASWQVRRTLLRAVSVCLLTCERTLMVVP